MKLTVDTTPFLNKYKSNSQKARVFSENWMSSEMYCPYCLNPKILAFSNNNKVTDYHCTRCQNTYQLKASNKKFKRKVIDGEYKTLINYLRNKQAPNFFLLEYSVSDWLVNNLFVIPKFFITTTMIEKRKPLSAKARRKGWIGCNIFINTIPNEAKIPIVNNGYIIPKEKVNAKIKKYSFLQNEENSQVGWITDILTCIERLNKDEFTLKELYRFRNYLSALHPRNSHIEAKIRQQLQILRDRGIILFVGNGVYTKTDH